MLDDKKGGFFKIAPSEGFYQTNQRYKKSTKGDPDNPNQTNILKTFFFNQFGNVVVTDFMPINIEQDRSDDIPKFGLKIVRKVKALKGNQKMTLTLKATPDWARKKGKIQQKKGQIYIEDSLYKMVLYTKYKASIKGDTITINFELKEDEDIFFGLSLHQKDEEIPTISKDDFHRIYKETEEYWEWWISKCSYNGPYLPVIQRSVLT
ncbi:hypothetical protein HYS97_01960, partial [Candidatus Daviesbacteria bacterium]|nr:hypothetical protein [Candidatus Daviesbacteria bacterium]